jgi:hypothetical protein
LKNNYFSKVYALKAVIIFIGLTDNFQNFAGRPDPALTGMEQNP